MAGGWVAGQCIFDDSATVQVAMSDAQAITSMYCEAITSMYCEAITSMHCEAITSMHCEAITSMHCEAITSMHCEAITSMYCEAITCVSMYYEDTHLLRGDCMSWRFEGRFALLIQRRGKERAKQSKPAMERESERGVGEVAKDTARGGWER